MCDFMTSNDHFLEICSLLKSQKCFLKFENLKGFISGLQHIYIVEFYKNIISALKSKKIGSHGTVQDLRWISVPKHLDNAWHEISQEPLGIEKSYWFHKKDLTT
jgi:hypothetical protein